MIIHKLFSQFHSSTKFYQELYRSRNTNLNSFEADSFFLAHRLPALSEEQSESCEGPITKK